MSRLRLKQLAQDGATNGQVPVWGGAGGWAPGTVSGGGGGGATTKISETTLASAASSITLSSIPSTYTHLTLVLTGRSTNPGTAMDDVLLRVNGDTASNYLYAFIFANGGTFTGNQINPATFGYLGGIPSAGAPAGQAGTARAHVPHYSGTTFRKMVDSSSMAPVNPGTTFYILRIQSVWTGTAPVSSLLFYLNSGANFVAGTTISLYGEA